MLQMLDLSTATSLFRLSETTSVIHHTTCSCCLQAASSMGSAAKRTRLSSPSKESAVAATRALQTDALDQDVKQVMNYADEKVC